MLLIRRRALLGELAEVETMLGQRVKFVPCPGCGQMVDVKAK